MTVAVAVALAALPSGPAVAEEESGKPAQISLRLAADPDRVLRVPAGTGQGEPWTVGDWTGGEDELWEPLGDSGKFNFKSVSNGLCSHRPVVDGGDIGAWDCAKSEGWTFVKKGDGYQIVDQRRGSCLAAASGRATTLPCSAAGSEEDVWLPVWEHRAAEPGFPEAITLRLYVDTGQAAVVSGNSTANGTQLMLWQIQDMPVYQWNPTAYQAPNGTRVWGLANVNSGLCANVAGGGAVDGTAIIQWPCGGQQNAVWWFAAQGAGYQVGGLESGKCLNVAGGAIPGQPLVLYTCQPGGAVNDVWLPVWEPND
ncbi:RICIN domain-containing protein [Phytomonospora endophytica]|uniref:Ricin B lectin domain-containing protein n=1 Tax=Phytomonospora endophytica TaxID=714109 RepID=A0A841FKQ9_9ACTN|nr:RICIN domain-containing protein [Phytomonospora endophytica]MBB6037921.1 hypothetical protein [Phytomonospora endophytica]